MTFFLSLFLSLAITMPTDSSLFVSTRPHPRYQFSWILLSSGLLRGVGWFETEVSGLPVGRIAWPSRMGPVGSSETSVLDHPTPRNNPQVWRQRSRIPIFFVSTHTSSFPEPRCQNISSFGLHLACDIRLSAVCPVCYTCIRFICCFDVLGRYRLRVRKSSQARPVSCVLPTFVPLGFPERP